MGKDRDSMKKNKKLPDNQITVYETSDGKINIEVLYQDENIWLSQKQMAELFDVDRSVVTKHLKNMFTSNELDESSVCANFAHTAEDGKTYNTNYYSLEAIIAVGYRVNSDRGTQFRQWAITILKEYIHKGFALDSDRFKYGSRFSARYDYTPKADVTKTFFATVQNKLHFAITGQTAAEIISKRADSKKSNMGLTSWRKSPTGKVMPKDVTVAKNYLKKDELDHLNRIVTMYLDFAELQAIRNKPMYMKDWVVRLNAFLKFSEYEILNDAGKVSHEVAIELAKKEYEEFRKEQDKNYLSDFDRQLKLLEEERAKYGDKK
ncbi:MAG: RhuM family protein [Candidatus Delongbacteria bacterium]|jgi:hypothetical protein|nr:RhuM family protein [Candidatus Delongbacteria bacterium]